MRVDEARHMKAPAANRRSSASSFLPEPRRAAEAPGLSGAMEAAMVVEETGVALAAVVVERAMVADWAAVLAVGMV